MALKKRSVIVSGSRVVALMLAVTVFAVGMLWCAAWMSFHEQYQLFQSTWAHFAHYMALPGGFSAYVAEFLVQFFLIPAAGSLVLVVLVLVLHGALLSLARPLFDGLAGALLCLLAVAFLARHMADVDVLISLLVSIDLVLVATVFCRRVAARWGGEWLPLPLLPLLYWLAGPAVWVGAVVLFIESVANRRWHAMAVLVAAVLLTVGVLWLSAPRQYPMWRVWQGLFYYRTPLESRPALWLTLAVLAVTPWLLRLCTGKPFKPLVRGTIALVVVVASVLLVRSGIDPVQREVVGYDYLVRTAQWDAVLNRARTVPPTRPMTTACVSLALSERGELSDKLFHYYQNGPQGLIPPFTRDYIESLTIGEIYYRLAMFNDAARLAFEAQGCIPDGRKSARCLQRLVSTSLATGHVEEAYRYQRLLNNTLFYKRDLAQLPHLVPQHADLQLSGEDLLYDGNNTVQVLDRLIAQHPRHRMAYEYLMAHLLLNRDIDGFMHFYPQGSQVGFDHIPRIYQEALVYVWSQQSNDFTAMPWPVDADVVHGVMNFARLYTTARDNPALREPPLSNTFWHYLLLGPAAPAKSQPSNIY